MAGWALRGRVASLRLGAAMTQNDIVDHALSTPLPVARLPRRMRRLRADVRNLYLGLEGLSGSAPNSALWHVHLHLLERSVRGLVREVGETSTRRIMARVEDALLIRRRQTQALMKAPSGRRSDPPSGQHPR